MRRKTNERLGSIFAVLCGQETFKKNACGLAARAQPDSYVLFWHGLAARIIFPESC